MPLHLDWSEIALRLALTIAAGFLVGLNRGERGHAAGIRTTILVCLAASVSMIQVNLLLPVAGKASDSFVVMDLMRLPLGILSGMGFIGAGAILRQKSRVSGVTTAATLWFVTVIGLCIGGGQWILGLVSLALALAVLTGLKALELRMRHELTGIIVLLTGGGAPTEAEVRERLLAAGIQPVASAVTYLDHGRQRRLSCSVQWRARPHDCAPPALVEDFARHPGVLEVEWLPQNADTGHAG